MLLSARGCTQECAICGGSHSAYRAICHRDRPAYRSPEKLAADVRAIASFSRAPIFMVHDPRMGGRDRALRFLSLLERIRPANEMIFELYYPAGAELFEPLARSAQTWSIEITLESPDERIRRRNGKFPWPNHLVEETIASAIAHGCRTVDVFFMVGLADQRREDVPAIADYCEHLLRRFGGGGRLRPFVAPLGPFLDPGSRAFEQPALGYRRGCTTLDDHRRAFLRDGWQQILSYETRSMTREDIAKATYDVAERLNEIKRRYGLIDDATFAGVARRLSAAREALTTTEHAGQLSQRAAELANHGTMFGDNELKWPVRHRFHFGWALARNLGIGLAQEVVHTAARLVGRYDVAPVVGHRA